MKFIPTIACLLLLPTFAYAQEEKLPAGIKLTSIEVRPDRIELKTPFAYQQLLLTGVLESGEKIDVTRIAKLTAPDCVKISERGQVRPVADGQGEVKYQVGELSGIIPLQVRGQKDPYEVSFTRDVMPTLSRLGCNAGTCHGGAQGKNGFQLSLRGYDPVFDHRALIDDNGGRRFNRAAPERSLMLLKTDGAVAHVGGVLTQPGTPAYELIRSWIMQGVKLNLQSPRVARIEISPTSGVLPLIGSKQQMAVLAHYTDGSTRDVSAEAFLESSNTEIATIDRQGIVTALRRGETAILARYDGNYSAATLVVMGDRSGFDWKETPEYNFIDKLVYDKLKQVKILPSEVCSDSDFIRRLYLDLTGLPPETDVTRAFLLDPKPSQQKREELIDRLVGSPEFIEQWTNKWADLLQVNRKFLGNPGAEAFRKWIRQAVTDNMPYDQFCYKLLTGTGSNVEHPEASYFKILRDPAGAMENSTHLFLAIRFNCNKCHDHPFERWTQNDYYQLSAFFAQVKFKEDPKYKGQKTEGSAVQGPLSLVEIVEDSNAGEIKNDRTGQNAIARFPYQFADLPKDATSRREQMARWITSKDNPYFAKSYVNRVWSYLLGVGIIEPIDDIRAGNPPSNPQLLDRLSEEFRKSEFDVRLLIKTICKSRTYQHSIATTKWNQDDDVNFSHAIARRLPAEVLYDSIHRVVGSTSHLPGLPAGSRAVQLVDTSVKMPFLDLFGRPPRESACECERSSGLQLGPVLNLVTGPVMADALRDPSNRIAKFSAAQKDDAKLVEELYLSILSRLPTAEEIKIGTQALHEESGDFARLQTQRQRFKDQLTEHEKKLPALQAQWETSVTHTPTWIPLDPTELKSAGGATLTKQPDLSILATGTNPSPETYILTFPTTLPKITGIRLEALADPSLPSKGPGRAPNGNFVLNDFKVELLKPGENEKPKQVKLTRPQADFSQDTFPIANVIDNNPETGWAVSPKLGENHVAVFELQAPIQGQPESKLIVKMLQKYLGKDHNLGKFRISVTGTRAPVLLQSSTPEAITKILDLPATERNPEQKTAVANHYRSLDQELSRLQRQYNDFVVPNDARTLGAQDLAWALMNTPAFLFNH